MEEQSKRKIVLSLINENRVRMKTHNNPTIQERRNKNRQEDGADDRANEEKLRLTDFLFDLMPNMYPYKREQKPLDSPVDRPTITHAGTLARRRTDRRGPLLDKEGDLVGDPYDAILGPKILRPVRLLMGRHILGLFEYNLNQYKYDLCCVSVHADSGRQHLPSPFVFLSNSFLLYINIVLCVISF